MSLLWPRNQDTEMFLIEWAASAATRTRLELLEERSNSYDKKLGARNRES